MTKTKIVLLGTLFSAIVALSFITLVNVTQEMNQAERLRKLKLECGELHDRQKARLAAMEDEELTIDQLINVFARRYRVDPNLIKAVIEAESSYNPKATSPVGAKGLMQLMPATARSMGVTDIYDPTQNIRGGTKLLAILLEAYNNQLPLALAAYNAGETAVNRHGGIPPYKETQQYVKKVLAFYDEYKNKA